MHAPLHCLALTTALLLAACTTTIETRDYDPARDATGIAGVRYYEPRLFRVRYDFSTLVDKSGAVLGTAATNGCRAIAVKEELTVLPDFAHPRVLVQKSGPFSNGRIGITLNNGMLTGVNVESSPQSADVLATLQKAVEAGAIALAIAPGGTPACNAGLVIGAMADAQPPVR